MVEGHTEGITAATISEDQTLLATTGYDKSVRLSMLATGAPVAVLDHAASGTGLSFSPDSSHLAVVLEDDSVVSGLECMVTWVHAHVHAFMCMGFSAPSAPSSCYSQENALKRKQMTYGCHQPLAHLSLSHRESSCQQCGHAHTYTQVRTHIHPCAHTPAGGMGLGQPQWSASPGGTSGSHQCMCMEP